MDEQVVSLKEIFTALKKRWLLIVFITVTCTLISSIVTFFVIKPKYEASTKVFIGKDNVVEGYNNNDVQMYQKLMKTLADIVKTRDLVDRATKNINTKMDNEAIYNNISVVPLLDTQILEIKLKDTDPKECAKVVEAIANEFAESAKELVTNGNVKIIESVREPKVPVSPNKKVNVALAFILGAMIGVGLAIVLEFIDNSFKNKEQLERETGIPVLGVIPSVFEERGVK